MSDHGHDMFGNGLHFRHHGRDNRWTHVVLPLVVLLLLALVGFGGGTYLTHSGPFQPPSSSVVPATNAQMAYFYLQDKGFGPATSAGIVGNLIVESNVDPKARSANGTSNGIAGWRDPAPINDYAKRTGRPASDLKLQLDYLVDDMNRPANSAMLAELVNANDYESATTIFALKYLRMDSHLARLPLRIEMAKDVLI